MSLTNPVKTDWTSADGVKNSDMNNIGANLNSLESSKAELNGDVSFNSITPIASVYGTQAISPSSTYLIPAGVYAVVLTSPQLSLEIWSGSVWINGLSSGSCIVSDGVNMRMANNSSSATHTLYYRKV